MDNTPKNNNGSDHQHVVVPLKIYFGVWICLLIFTVITVAASYFDFGSANILIAMVIASIKALLVILFFMGLRYDGQENNVTFYISFVFFAIFISLTASDLLYRHHLEGAKIDPSGIVESSGAVDVKGLMQVKPETIAKGQALFQQQCISCHGAKGEGDGPAAAALNPKPRNFKQTTGWTFGRNLSDVFKTLTNGSPGTSMPPFSTLGIEERMELVHYVRSIMPEAPAVTAADEEALQKLIGSGQGQSRLSIAFAMDKLAVEEEPTAVSAMSKTVKGQGTFGAQIFQQNCASCHGMDGSGGNIVQSLGVEPFLRERTRPLSKPKYSEWLENREKFTEMVSEGFPGRGMPGFGKFSKEEWSALYDYVKDLAK